MKSWKLLTGIIFVYNTHIFEKKFRFHLKSISPFSQKLSKLRDPSTSNK